MPLGIASNPGCARNPCAPLVANGQWQSTCGGIDAFEVKGPCTATLAQSGNGVNPIQKIFQPGFHGIWAITIGNINLGDNIRSVKFNCTGKCILNNYH